MADTVKVVVPRYQQVAADIASKIVDRRYQVGERIYARSSIASQYAVSAETARRAIAILSDLGIVQATKGSGVLIQSHEKAVEFVRRFQETSTLTELKRDAIRRAESLARESAELKEAVAKLTDHSDQLRFINPFVPYEVTMESFFSCAGKSLSELCFWQNTGATVVAIRREQSLILSPGPYETLKSGDIVYFVGEESCSERVEAFLR